MSLVQVVPEGGTWKVVVDGNQEGTTYDIQEEAAGVGRTKAQGLGAEFQLHGTDGSIREKDSYGNDPSNIPG